MKRRRPQGRKFISDNVLAGGVSTKSIPFLVSSMGISAVIWSSNTDALVLYAETSSYRAALDTPRAIVNRAGQRISFTRLDRAVCENGSGYRAHFMISNRFAIFQTEMRKNGTVVPPAIPSDIEGVPGGPGTTGSSPGLTPVGAEQTKNRPGRVLV